MSHEKTIEDKQYDGCPFLSSLIKRKQSQILRKKNGTNKHQKHETPSFFEVDVKRFLDPDLAGG